MKKTLLLAAACLAASLALAAPPMQPGQMQLRAKLRPCAALGVSQNSMYNPRFFDGNMFTPQINNYCFAHYPAGSGIFSAGVVEATRQTRMVSPFRGADSSTYMLASGGSLNPYTRYNWDGTGPQDVAFPDGQLSESFDWADNDTIIATDYTSGNRKRLYLLDVTAAPFALTKNITWNANAYITRASSTRIRNVRVGQTYPNYAYYGDNGVSVNPKVYALNLTTGVETELGSWNGTLKDATTSRTGSFGLWTVVERGGSLYLQSSDDGVQVYSMTGPTTLGSMYTSYSLAQLSAVTGDTDGAFYGFDVAADGQELLLGAYLGSVYEVQRRAPIASGEWQLGVKVRPCDILGQTQNSMYNPRYFDGNIYATEISGPAYRCFGVFTSGSGAYVKGGIPPVNEHRMLGRLHSTGLDYLMRTGGDDGAGNLIPTSTRYYYGSDAQAVTFMDSQVSESYDWVDDNTVVATDYTSGNRKRIYLVDVAAEPFALINNTTWNANGYVTTAVTTHIRNVRVGQVYSSYAYYGDAGQNTNPKFYALELATGVSAELGSLGTLTGGGSFGLWTVLERGGYLYVQTTDNGIQVYDMVNATTLGSLVTTYTKAELDAATGINPGNQYYGLDVSADNATMLLGAPLGSVYELAPACHLSVFKSGANVVLTWPSYYSGAVVQSTADLSQAFTDITPQPTLSKSGNSLTAAITASGAQYYRLR